MKKILMVMLVGVVMSGCGKTGPAGSNGKDGASGANGSNGANGADGTNGSNGADGTNGADGKDGKDGTQMTIVKFCPGATVYPSKFVEIGFCIDNKLYAVYSANGGFESEIPPGSYGSNGINASCNFVVLANCGIQN